MPDVLSLTLPMPPSTNNLFINVRGRGRIKSPEYRQWMTTAGKHIMAQRPGKIEGPVFVDIELPERDASPLSDGDNRLKGVFDALVKHRIIQDDNRQIVRGFSVVWADRDDVAVFVQADTGS